MNNLGRVVPWPPKFEPGKGEAALVEDDGRRRGAWRIAWTVVFALNLVVPLMLGWSMCGPAGQFGLVVATLTYYALGLVACDGRARWRRALVYGGVLMALSQLFPMAQIGAGKTALDIWSYLSGPRIGSLDGPGGCIVTGLTGGILLTAALLSGLVVDLVFHRRSKLKPKPKPWDEI